MAATGLDPSTLYETHRGMVYQLAYRWLPKFPRGSKLDVDDLAQEGFLELLKAAPSYRPERGSPSTFVGVVVRNRFYHLLTRNYARWSATSATDPTTFDTLQIAPEQDVLDTLSDYLRAGRVVVRNRYRRLAVRDLLPPTTSCIPTPPEKTMS